jgi:hypothetical protein
MRARLLILLVLFAVAAACTLPEASDIYPDDDDSAEQE